LSHCPEPSGHAVHEEVDGLDIEGQHGRRFVLLRHTHRSQRRPHLLARLFFNIYISDLTTTVSRKYAYADDLAITHVDEHWQAVERVLTRGGARRCQGRPLPP